MFIHILLVKQTLKTTLAMQANSHNFNSRTFNNILFLTFFLIPTLIEWN